MIPFHAFRLLLGSLTLIWVTGLGVVAAKTPPSPQTIARRVDRVQRADHGGAIARFQRSRRRWIEINLSSQRLIAWEGKVPTYAILVSTGKDSSQTPTGVFAIQTQERYARMRGSGYDVPNVPYTMYFMGNYAIHGAYWHHRFGTPVSHGCINLAVNHARWLFSWASLGTPVVIHH